jgi:signal peptidase I
MKQPLKQWIKFAVAAIICLLFTIWIGNLLILLLLPFIFDVYITKRIPWTWWRNSKNPLVRSVMSWVDAIVFALVAVYIINLFFFQNYQIPSSSLEKSLLVGDFLFVSKVAYGPRVPNTPLSFPLVQNTFPVFNCKSYFDKPQWDYKRLKGFGHVKRNDIVVFNFPAGDTILLNYQNPDYYSQCYLEGYRQLQSTEPGVTPDRQQCFALGREVVRMQSGVGPIMYRPVDRRENYVKRCIGLPGEILKIVNNQVFINNVPVPDQPGVQYNYLVQTDGSFFTDEIFKSLNVSKGDDRKLLSPDYISAYGIDLTGFVKNSAGNLLPVYLIPLTKDALAKVKAMKMVVGIKIDKPAGQDPSVFPQGYTKGWNRDNFGPIWIPKKGTTLALNTDILPLYERVINAYEHNDLKVVGNVIYINGKKADSYTFKMDYYWMMGDNRHNSADSRYWGFVPEDHIVGQPLFVWLSLDKDRSFLGKIRWNRFFKSATH